MFDPSRKAVYLEIVRGFPMKQIKTFCEQNMIWIDSKKSRAKENYIIAIDENCSEDHLNHLLEIELGKDSFSKAYRSKLNLLDLRRRKSLQNNPIPKNPPISNTSTHPTPIKASQKDLTLDQMDHKLDEMIEKHNKQENKIAQVKFLMKKAQTTIDKEEKIILLQKAKALLSSIKTPDEPSEQKDLEQKFIDDLQVLLDKSLPLIRDRLDESRPFSKKEFGPNSFGRVEEFNKIKSIALYNQNLTQLPHSIGALCDLLNLNLRGNKINILPEELGQCNKLRFLDLDGNNLDCLPASFDNLVNLTTLVLTNNFRLQQLPKSLDLLLYKKKPSQSMSIIMLEKEKVEKWFSLDIRYRLETKNIYFHF